jgi:hypothetical protein
MLAPHCESIVHEHAEPQVTSQLLCAAGAHEPSLSHVPLHVCAEQSGQHSGPTLEPSSVQHRLPVGHSPCEPPEAHAAVALVMHTP